MAIYQIWNDTDNISATMKTFRKVHTAEKHIKVMRDTFRKVQGYYRTNTWEKISPDDIQYRIIQVK